MNKKYFGALFLTMVLITSGYAASAHAQTDSTQGASGSTGGSSIVRGEMGARGEGHRGGMMGGKGMGMHRPMVAGTVTAINGNIITVSSAMPMGPQTSNTTTTTPVTYTIDATNAKVDTNRTASTVANITVGNFVAAEGTLTGTNLVAKAVHFSTTAPVMGAKGERGNGKNEASDTNGGAESAMMPEGNGQPIIGGTVTAVNGNSVTITNKSNVAYTLDITSAKVTKLGQASTAASVVVGDAVTAQGSINGTTVTAATLMDHGVPPTATQTTTDTQAKPKGFFGKVGGFFGHLFGF